MQRKSGLGRSGLCRSHAVAAAIAAMTLGWSFVATAQEERSKMPVMPCAEAGFHAESPRELSECRYESAKVRGTESGHQLGVSRATGSGMDTGAGTRFYLVRVDAGRNVIISDAEVGDFASWHLLAGSADITYQEPFGEFEVAEGEGEFVESLPTSCYVFLRQWGYGLAAGYRHQFGGLYCGADGLPDRQKLEEFLTTTSYEAE